MFYISSSATDDLPAISVAGECESNACAIYAMFVNYHMLSASDLPGVLTNFGGGVANTTLFEGKWRLDALSDYMRQAFGIEVKGKASSKS
jgi:hypothetical protein